MRRLWTVVCLLSGVGILVSASPGLDPADEIYAFLALCEGAGYVDHLPPLKPYPETVLRELLSRVVDRSTGLVRERALRYLDQVGPETSIEGSGRVDLRMDASGEFFGIGGGGIDARMYPASGVEILADWGLYLVDKQEGASLALARPPRRDLLMEGMALSSYETLQMDLVADSSDFEIGERTYYVKQSIHSAVTLGSTDLFFQAGLMRSSYGVWDEEGIVISQDAPHAPRFDLVWRTPWFTYTWLYMELVATDNEGAGSYRGKHLRLQGLSIPIFPWLSFGVWETVIWGPEFDLYYFLPLSQLTYQQIYAGAPDNSLFGLSLAARLPHGIKAALEVYVDDAEFYDLVEFNFNTLYKASLRAGVQWSAFTPFLAGISLDYLLITPYMYTHRDSDVNYLNYTHDGVNLGPALPPNSDRIQVKAVLTPVSSLRWIPSLRFIRHGNASEGYENVEPGDGSIFDDGYTEDGYPTFDAQPTRFLTQEVIEKTLQITQQLSYEVPAFHGVLELEGGYRYEYIWNVDLEEGREAMNHYFWFGTRFSW